MSTYPSAPPTTHRFFAVAIGDVSTAGSVWFVPGFRGRIRKIWSVIDAAITVANAGLTFEIGGVAVSGSAITIATSGSAAGTVDSAVPPIGLTNSFDVGQPIEIVKDGASTTASNGVVTFELEPT